jgi:hypothetical protein
MKRKRTTSLMRLLYMMPNSLKEKIANARRMLDFHLYRSRSARTEAFREVHLIEADMWTGILRRLTNQ